MEVDLTPRKEEKKGSSGGEWIGTRLLLIGSLARKWVRQGAPRALSFSSYTLSTCRRGTLLLPQPPLPSLSLLVQICTIVHCASWM
jgi:hypothetical protein